MEIQEKYLIVISGPTCIGKTTIANQIANEFNSALISADSRQVYKELRIGTARPSEIELSRLKYLMIGSHSIHNPITASKFESEALDELKRIYLDNQFAIMVGGTGLFIDAVLNGLDQIPEISSDYVAKWNRLFQENGIAYLQSILSEKDPDYYDIVDLNNPRRLIRALTVNDATSKQFSSFLSGKKKKRSFIPIPLVLDIQREILYEQINQRVDQMIRDGLVQEVKQLIPYKHLSSLQTLGYQELFLHFEGALSLNEAIDKIKQNTRRYAKRQITWFKRYPNWPRFNPKNVNQILDYIRSSIK